MKTIKHKSRGLDVSEWQRFLVSYGMKIGAVDGIFGTLTDRATMRFQDGQGLVADGIVGRKTYAKASLLGFGREDTGYDLRGPDWPPRPAFEPLIQTSARQRQFGTIEFDYTPTPDNPERISITNKWAHENIVRLRVPQLDKITIYRAPVHRKIIDQFLGLWKAWERAGLLHLVHTWHGAYVPRLVRGSSKTLSNHAFGTAFDINARWNRLRTQPALSGEKGSVRDLVPLANEYGFYWGGHYSRRLDGMHFEVAVCKGGE